MEKLEGDFSKEVRIVPWWSYLLGALGFMCVQLVFHVAILRHPNPPTPPVRALIGLLLGLLLFGWFMLLGYVNRDAGRRGMSRALWTVLVIVIPNFLGYLVYFLVRKPLHIPCPYCGAPAEPGFTYCTKCGKALKPSCSNCGAQLRPEDRFCPACGKPVGQPA